MRKRKICSVIIKEISKDKKTPISIAKLFFEKDKSNNQGFEIVKIHRHLDNILEIIVFLNKLMSGIKILIKVIISIWF
jgi:hypothetical protein